MGVGKMNKKYLLGAGALIIILVIALVAVIVAGSNGAKEPAGTPSTKPAPTSTPTATATAQSAQPMPSPSPTPASTAIKITYGCMVGGGVVQFDSLKEVWARADTSAGCNYGTQSEGTPSEVELAAIEAADYRVEGLKSLYSVCTKLTGPPITEVFTASQARELEGAYMLCPNHPNAAEIENALVHGRTLIAAEDASKTATAEGRQIMSGHYLIGVDIQPGTWETVLDKVTECYWEISDAQGNILENNFVNTAPRFSIDIPATAAGLTIQGCAFRQVG